MFWGIDFLSLIAILGFGAVLIYPIGFLHRKKIFHLSLLQILYLVVIPGFLLVLGNSYIRQVLERPYIESSFLSDGFLVNLILLSMFFSYGGVAIHAVTKMLSEFLKKKDENDDFAMINRFFHLSFSHNLIFGGIILFVFGFVMLEFNHVPGGGEGNLWWLIIKGLILGISLVTAMFLYTRSRSSYVGRWADLRAVFFVFWILGVILIYGLRYINLSWTSYNTLIPAVVSFGVVAFLNVVLVIRRLKNGKIVFDFNWERLIGRRKK
jgi:hypothetical protein